MLCNVQIVSRTNLESLQLQLPRSRIKTLCLCGKMPHRFRSILFCHCFCTGKPDKPAGLFLIFIMVFLGRRPAFPATAPNQPQPATRLSPVPCPELCARITVSWMNHQGGDLASTRVTKPEVHAEVQITSLIQLQTNIVANDDNYALAA